ncbi:MAG TPA: cupredoxin domain-containing protein [bacterium]|nr:cupredoxin domain-containing protein [bacterium]
MRVAALGLSAITLLFIAAATTHTLWRRLTRAVKPEEIRITLTDTTLDPAVILLHPGSVRFAILNAGREDHTFTVQGMGVVAQVADLPPEGTGSLDVTFSKPGTYRLLGGRPGTDSPASSLTVRP